MNNIQSAQRILIVGDAGRGKTTLAEKLSDILKLPLHSTDDFLWRKKFTEQRPREEALTLITKIYHSEQWVVEGTTRQLIEPGLKKANIILHLRFRTFFAQWCFLIKRSLGRKDESTKDLFILLRHTFYKRYSLSYTKSEPQFTELLNNYKQKTITLYNFHDINTLLETMK